MRREVAQSFLIVCRSFHNSHMRDIEVEHDFGHQGAALNRLEPTCQMTKSRWKWCVHSGMSLRLVSEARSPNYEGRSSSSTSQLWSTASKTAFILHLHTSDLRHVTCSCYNPPLMSDSGSGCHHGSYCIFLDLILGQMLGVRDHICFKLWGFCHRGVTGTLNTVD